MALTEEQRERTRDEMRANFTLSELTPEEAARALGFSPEKLDEALDLASSVHPADVWMLRDYLVREVLARGADLVPFTVLTSSARLDAAQWFNLRPR